MKSSNVYNLFESETRPDLDSQLKWFNHVPHLWILMRLSM